MIDMDGKHEYVLICVPVSLHRVAVMEDRRTGGQGQGEEEPAEVSASVVLCPGEDIIIYCKFMIETLQYR